MSKTDMDLYKENLRLKKEFALRNLPLEEITEFAPYNLELENRRLQNLLLWVDKYEEVGSREAMELIGMEFPPVLPGLSPDADWYKFTAWLDGKELFATIESRFSNDYKPLPAEEISEENIAQELEKLLHALYNVGLKTGYVDGLPARIEYAMLMDYIKDKHDVLGSGKAAFGGWTFDGCSGTCIICVQRPWCASGQEMCWDEDKEAGKIYFVPELKDYVSASPQSLELLQESQAKFDASMAKYREEREQEKRNQDSGYIPSPFDAQTKDDAGEDLPFNMN